MITSGIRTVRAIESAVRERVSCAGDSRENNSSSGEEYITAWRAKLCEISSMLYLRLFELTATKPAVPQPSHGDLRQVSALGPGTHQEHVQRYAGSEPVSTPAFVIVRHGFIAGAGHSLLIIFQ